MVNLEEERGCREFTSGWLSTQCIGILLNLEEEDGEIIQPEEPAGSFSDGKRALQEQKKKYLLKTDNLRGVGLLSVNIKSYDSHYLKIFYYWGKKFGW